MIQPTDGLIAPLHSLRGIAALTVVVGHANVMTGFPGIDTAASLGVVLFFALSGFLMGHLYLTKPRSRHNLLQYGFARFGRIYPLFAFVIVVTTVIPLVLPVASPFLLELDDLPRHLTLFGEGRTVWTVSVECQFYAVFFILWIAYSAIPHRRDEVFFGLLALFIAVTWFVGYPEGRINLLGYIHLFLLGIMGAIVWQRAKNTIERISPWLLPLLLLGYFAMFFITPRIADPRYIYSDLGLCVACTLLVVSAAGSSHNITGRLLSLSPLVFLGDISFGVYLLHRPVMAFWETWGVAGLQGPSLLIVLILLTVFTAWLAHIAIEKPARSAVRAWGGRFMNRQESGLKYQGWQRHGWPPRPDRS